MSKRKLFVPNLEELENRLSPALWEVTTLADAGQGSLRNILTGVQQMVVDGALRSIQDNDTVEFRVPVSRWANPGNAADYQETIRLFSSVFCDKSVTIIAPPVYNPAPAPRNLLPIVPAFYSITIDGSYSAQNQVNPHRALLFANPNHAVNVTVNSLAFRNCGTAPGVDGAAIFATGALTLQFCRFENNTASGRGVRSLSIHTTPRRPSPLLAAPSPTIKLPRVGPSSLIRRLR